MLVNLDGRGMIAVFPECAVVSFALIVFLATGASDQLHAISDNLWTGISNQKVNVVAGHYVIKYGKTEALLRFENPAQIGLPIAASELAERQIPNLIPIPQSNQKCRKRGGILEQRRRPTVKFQSNFALSHVVAMRLKHPSKHR